MTIVSVARDPFDEPAAQKMRINLWARTTEMHSTTSSANVGKAAADTFGHTPAGQHIYRDNSFLPTWRRPRYPASQSRYIRVGGKDQLLKLEAFNWEQGAMGPGSNNLPASSSAGPMITVELTRTVSLCTEQCSASAAYFPKRGNEWIGGMRTTLVRIPYHEY